ncbi:uncharacterized protein LOC132334783 isoform X19 [Haemorhous mexicanus]|uniref:uncharacterized protein LOC132334783 isoform X19 n=1 Tax=Haemorhous mexicanus TaxID=30427 RepID=UPI0028BD3519|nr:uncharacterized protein LOC132334783 isoform X19 [Haemorhous mexicanus]
MKVAVLSVALLFSILLCPPAQAKGLRMPLDRCPPPKMPGPPRGPLPNQGSWSESGAGPVPQVGWTLHQRRALLEGTQDDLREPPVAKVLRALLQQKRLAASLDA